PPPPPPARPLRASRLRTGSPGSRTALLPSPVNSPARKSSRKPAKRTTTGSLGDSMFGPFDTLLCLFYVPHGDKVPRSSHLDSNRRKWSGDAHEFFVTTCVAFSLNSLKLLGIA